MHTGRSVSVLTVLQAWVSMGTVTVENHHGMSFLMAVHGWLKRQAVLQCLRASGTETQQCGFKECSSKGPTDLHCLWPLGSQRGGMVFIQVRSGFIIWAITVQGDYKIHHFLHPKLTSKWRNWLNVCLNWAFTQLTSSCVVCVELQSLESVKLLWS